MKLTSPDSDAPVPVWRRGQHRYALLIVLAFHLLLLMVALLSRSRAPAQKPAASVDVVMFQEKPPEIKIPDTPPPKLEVAPEKPPSVPVVEMPKLEVVPDVIKPPPAPKSAPEQVASKPEPPPPPPPAPVVAAVPPAPPKLFEECADSPDRRMVADVYKMRTGSQSVKEMRGRPVKKVCLSQLNVASRSFLEGFPGLGSMNEWFGLDIRFTVNIPEATTWELMLVADDGAILSIDDENVIDNDGIHGEKAVATVQKLEKGLHNFRVRYFQGPAPDLALMLVYKKQGTANYAYLPKSMLGRPPGAAVAALQPKE